MFSSGETGLYVQILSSPLVNSAPISYVRSMFEKQKLPFDLGWRPSAVPITFATLGEYVLELFAVNPDKAAEGMGMSTCRRLKSIGQTLTSIQILCKTRMPPRSLTSLVERRL